MAFSIEKFVENSGPLQIDDLDFESFREQPLDDASLRALRYMHDVEFHTVCYMRDLLVTRAHNDPEITTFMTMWNLEEYWHGEAISYVLKLHDEIAGAPRVEETRELQGTWGRVKPIASIIGSSLFKEFPAVHMAWGAVNEYSAQAAYAALIQHAQHPTLTTMLKRIMKQEGRHVDFYAHQAATRLENSTKAQKLTRFALSKAWGPVGSGVLPKEEVAFMVDFLFGNEPGWKTAERIDRNIDRLPGLEGLDLIKKSILKMSTFRPTSEAVALAS